MRCLGLGSLLIAQVKNGGWNLRRSESGIIDRLCTRIYTLSTVEMLSPLVALGDADAEWYMLGLAARLIRVARDLLVLLLRKSFLPERHPWEGWHTWRSNMCARVCARSRACTSRLCLEPMHDQVSAQRWPDVCACARKARRRCANMMLDGGTDRGGWRGWGGREPAARPLT